MAEIVPTVSRLMDHVQANRRGRLHRGLMKITKPVTLVFVLVLTGCTRTPASTAGQTPTPRDQTTPERVAQPNGVASHVGPMWPNVWESDPELGRVPMTLAEATSSLPFAPIVPPEEVGASPTLTASDPDRFPKKDRGLAWLYKDAAGPFAVIEGVAGEGAEQLLEKAATCQPGETGCSTVGWSLGTLPGGHTALVINGSAATSVAWVQGPVEFLVIGPAESFSPAQAMSIANEMEAAAGS